MARRAGIDDVAPIAHTLGTVLLDPQPHFSIIHCDAVYGWPISGRRTVRPALNGRAHASAACCRLFRALRDLRDLANSRSESRVSHAERSKLRPANETSGSRSASLPTPAIGVFPGQRGGG